MTIMVWYLINFNAMEGLAATLVQGYLFQTSNQDLRSVTWHFVLSQWDSGFVGLIMGGVSCGRSNLEKDAYLPLDPLADGFSQSSLTLYHRVQRWYCVCRACLLLRYWVLLSLSLLLVQLLLLLLLVEVLLEDVYDEVEELSGLLWYRRRLRGVERWRREVCLLLGRCDV